MDEAAREYFTAAMLAYYGQHGRYNLPWRLPDQDGSFDPYKILVSEVMLQQTQVPRVLPKYLNFIERFPTAAALAGASLKDVLIAWQGLGYNRRARYLWQAAQIVADDCSGIFPRSVPELTRLPGVGANTAGAILAYAFDQPVLFIETNIRTVFIHHFFRGKTQVSDKEIEAVLADVLAVVGKGSADPPQGGAECTSAGANEKLRPEGPQALAWCGAGVSYREFYWALMDYGTHLKQTVGNANRTSKGYSRQSRFVGSARQVRGQVLRLLAHRPMSRGELQAVITDERLRAILQDLEAEGLICRRGASYDLP